MLPLTFNLDDETFISTFFLLHRPAFQGKQKAFRLSLEKAFEMARRSVAEQREGAHRSGSSAGILQPASALFGHKGIMLLELIGVLGLNSLMFVKHLMVFGAGGGVVVLCTFDGLWDWGGWLCCAGL